jgi:hypothetical protein
VLMAIRLVRNEVPRCPIVPATTLVSVRRSPPPYFRGLESTGNIEHARACHGNAKTAIPGVIIRAMEERPIWVGR